MGKNCLASKYQELKMFSQNLSVEPMLKELFKRHYPVLLWHDIKTNNLKYFNDYRVSVFCATHFLPSPKPAFSQRREKFISTTVHLQACFGFALMFACLVSWLSCLFIATALLSHFHFPICTRHSQPASLQKCAPRTCFLTVTFLLPTASGLGEVKRHRWPE